MKCHPWLKLAELFKPYLLFIMTPAVCLAVTCVIYVWYVYVHVSRAASKPPWLTAIIHQIVIYIYIHTHILCNCGRLRRLWKPTLHNLQLASISLHKHHWLAAVHHREAQILTAQREKRKVLREPLSGEPSADPWLMADAPEMVGQFAGYNQGFLGIFPSAISRITEGTNLPSGRPVP